jgi:Na+/H+ antiporter NhaD/arsenite permease-like protein
LDITTGITALIILTIYAAIAIGRVPALRMNRATIALVGAGILLLIGAIDEEHAFEAIDLGTITLLFGMMIINVNLSLAGFFGLVGDRVLRLARSPGMLLALVIAASGVLSALFLNDTICVLFTPFVVDITLRARRNPIPYLMGLATAANIGSTATITGNPQNLLIGQASGIPYLTFLAQLAPVALAGLVVAWVVIVLLYRREFRTPLIQPDLPAPRVHRRLLTTTLLVVASLLIAFLVGAPIATAAFIAACALLLSRLKPDRLLRIDWNLLAFFCGLFVITGALETTGLSAQLFEAIRPIIDGGVAPLSVATAALSNVVSNVPAVLLFRPIVPQLPDPETTWLTLAMASTLAGNLTLLGSVANLIVAESAGQRGVRLSFGEYLRAGVPITILTILIGVVWLSG